MIAGAVNQSDNGILEKYCYNDLPSNCDTYGGLYTWSEAMKYLSSQNLHGICPAGWHIPTSDEFNTLKNFVHNDANALKAPTEGTGAFVGTNTSGFSAMLAGSRGTGGHYTHQRVYGIFWNSTDYDPLRAYVHQVDYNVGDVSYYANGKEAAFSVRCIKDDLNTDVSDNSTEIPAGYSIAQNYPNPFNPSTIIEYHLPQTEYVTLKVFDLLGNEAATLVSGVRSAGVHSVEFDGSRLSSGTYFYRIKAGNFTGTKKFLLVK
jgi:uncharacterized protein (TIGR02145 family)